MHDASWQSIELQFPPVPMNGSQKLIFLAGRLQTFDRVERIQDELELAVAARAGRKMFFYSQQQAVDRRAVETRLGVPIELIQAFRTRQLDFLGVLDHL
jgi:hypothetical protein